jgi:hypothetical protein
MITLPAFMRVMGRGIDCPFCIWGPLDSAFMPNVGGSNAIYGTVVQRCGEILVAGEFSTVGPVVEQSGSPEPKDPRMEDHFELHAFAGLNRMVRGL